MSLDGQQRGGVLVERAKGHGGFTLFHNKSVMRPLIGARIVVLARLVLASRTDAVDCSTLCVEASRRASFTSSWVLVCSRSASDTSCGLVFRISTLRDQERWACRKFARACAACAPGGRQAPPRHAARRPRRPRIDLQEEVATLHHLAFLDGQPDDASADVGGDVDLGPLTRPLAVTDATRSRFSIGLDTHLGGLSPRFAAVVANTRRRQPPPLRRSTTSLSCSLYPVLEGYLSGRSTERSSSA